MHTTTHTLIVPNVESVDVIDTFTRGFIVPAGAEVTDVELDAVDHVDIPAVADEDEWWQGLRDAAAHAGWALDGPITQDGTKVTAGVSKARP